MKLSKFMFHSQYRIYRYNRSRLHTLKEAMDVFTRGTQFDSHRQTAKRAREVGLITSGPAGHYLEQEGQ